MIPKTYECYKPILELLADGKEHTSSEVKEHVAKYFKVTDDERKILTSRGKRRLFDKIVLFAITHLRKARAIENARRGSTK